MRILKDCNGNEWKLELNIATARPLVKYLESLEPPVDLFDASSFMPRASSILFAIDCLAVLTYDERTARGVSDIDFGRALYGKTAYEFQRALLAEYVDFFPEPNLSATLKKSLEKIEETSIQEQRIIEAVLNQAIQERQEEVERLGSSILPS